MTTNSALEDCKCGPLSIDPAVVRNHSKLYKVFQVYSYVLCTYYIMF